MYWEVLNPRTWLPNHSNTLCPKGEKKSYENVGNLEAKGVQVPSPHFIITMESINEDKIERECIQCKNKLFKVNTVYQLLECANCGLIQTL